MEFLAGFLRNIGGIKLTLCNCNFKILLLAAWEIVQVVIWDFM